MTHLQTPEWSEQPRTDAVLPAAEISTRDRRGGIRHRWAAAATGALLALLPAAGHPQITIEVAAQNENASSDGFAFPAAEQRAWGWSFAGSQGANTVFGTGPAPCDTITCPPGPSLPGGAGAVARADATQMNLGVRSWAFSTEFGADGAAEVEVRDSIVTSGFTTLQMNFHIDLSAFSVSTAPGSEGRYTFAVLLGSGDNVSTAFAFTAERRYTSGNVFETLAQVIHNDDTIIDLGDIPSSYEVTLPVFFAPGITPIQVVAAAFAEGPSNTGAVNVNAYNSSWLGIQGEYTSVNGYSYPGFAAAIPEPSALALWATGILGVLIAVTRRRAR